MIPSKIFRIEGGRIAFPESGSPKMAGNEGRGNLQTILNRVGQTAFNIEQT